MRIIDLRITIYALNLFKINLIEAVEKIYSKYHRSPCSQINRS